MALTNYNWDLTFSYNAPITVVLTSRGVGKTYGFRFRSIKEFRKKGYRTAEIVRTKEELSDFGTSYFLKVGENPDLQDLTFKSTTRRAYIADKPENENERPNWKEYAYFVSLSEAQIKKKITYPPIPRVMFDEFIIDRSIDHVHNYLPNEYDILRELFDTLTRERPGDGTKPHLYMCANAVDLANPYFKAWGIYEEPPRGYSWWMNKTVLVHYPDPGEYGLRKATETVAGKMGGGAVSAFNRFDTGDNEFYCARPKNAKYLVGLVYRGSKYAIWDCPNDGFYYVDTDVKTDQNHITYALTTDDNRINYYYARRMNKAMKGIVELYSYGALRYKDFTTKKGFEKALSLFGVR